MTAPAPRPRCAADVLSVVRHAIGNSVRPTLNGDRLVVDEQGFLAELEAAGFRVVAALGEEMDQ